METIGILLANTGTPDAPTARALRPYLAHFLGDPRVIDYPKLIWNPILHGIILNVRPQQSAAKYRAIWTPDGSPLLVNSRRLADKLHARLSQRGAMQVALGMRYSKPTIAAGLKELANAGAQRILVLPLFPQYSVTTTASIFDAVHAAYRRARAVPELRWIRDYHTDPDYIRVLAAHIDQYWTAQGAPERVLFSFHGIPRRYVSGGDPYYAQCQATANRLAEQLGVAPGQWGIGFQSRFGPEPWLEPYTDQLLKRWAKKGVKTVDTVCPGFATDGLETLEEVAVEYGGEFHKAGGERFRYIPCLNDDDSHVDLLTQLVLRNVQGWLP